MIKRKGKVDIDSVITPSRHANYKIDVGWDYVESTLDNWRKDFNLKIKPDYQRKHVWKVVQQLAYIESMLKGCVGGRDIYFNAANWQGMGKVGNIEVVDGLQRLTAVLGFTNNKFKIFGKYYYRDFKLLPFLNRASFRFHVNNLKTKNEVIDWYILLNDTGVAHTKNDIKHALSCKTK